MNFHQALEKIYFQDPCGVLSLPLGKILPCIDEWETAIRVDETGQISHLEAWSDDSLQVYWDRERLWEPAAPQEIWRTPVLTVIHSRYASRIRLTSNLVVQRYFRLSLTRPCTHFDLPGSFRFAQVQMPAEATQVAEVIGRSYAHLRPSVEEVMRWHHQPEFDERLWIWVIDQRVNQPAGLGIAELDPRTREASLEWIQVIPEFRGQGLAKAIVCRLLGVLQREVRLVTVSGEADNPTDAEHIYRRCGFEGQDIWWVIRRLGI